MLQAARHMLHAICCSSHAAGGMSYVTCLMLSVMSHAARHMLLVTCCRRHVIRHMLHAVCHVTCCRRHVTCCTSLALSVIRHMPHAACRTTHATSRMHAVCHRPHVCVALEGFRQFKKRVSGFWVMHVLLTSTALYWTAPAPFMTKHHHGLWLVYAIRS
jgi:hypothetical protein